MVASIACTALSKPGGFTGGTVVVAGVTAGRVPLVEGGTAVALVVGAGGAVPAAIDGAAVVSDSTPRATEGGGIRAADSSA